MPGGVRAAHGTVTATGIARSDEQSKFPQGAADAKKTGRDLLHPPYDAFVSTGAAGATQMLEIVRHAVGQDDTPITPTMSARARGTAPCTWFTVSCMASSSRFGGGMGSRPRRAHSRLGGAAVVLTHDRRAGSRQEAHSIWDAAGDRYRSGETPPLPIPPALVRP